MISYIMYSIISVILTVFVIQYVTKLIKKYIEHRNKSSLKNFLVYADTWIINDQLQIQIKHKKHTFVKYIGHDCAGNVLVLARIAFGSSEEVIVSYRSIIENLSIKERFMTKDCKKIKDRILAETSIRRGI